MPSLTKKNRNCKNNHNSTIKIPLLLDRARSSPTNTMWSLMPRNQGYQSMRQEQEEDKLKTQKTLLKNRLRKKIEKIKNVQNSIIYAEKNKQNIASKYDEDYDDEDYGDEYYDEEVTDINKTWKTCEGDYTHTLRKSPTTRENLKDLVGGKKSKKKTRKQRKKKKPIHYRRKSIKYK